MTKQPDGEERCNAGIQIGSAARRWVERGIAADARGSAEWTRENKPPIVGVLSERGTGA